MKASAETKQTGERERERERHTDTDRQRSTQTCRQTDQEAGRHSGGQKHKYICVGSRAAFLVCPPCLYNRAGRSMLVLVPPINFQVACLWFVFAHCIDGERIFACSLCDCQSLSLPDVPWLLQSFLNLATNHVQWSQSLEID